MENGRSRSPSSIPSFPPGINGLLAELFPTDSWKTNLNPSSTSALSLLLSQFLLQSATGVGTEELSILAAVAACLQGTSRRNLNKRLVRTTKMGSFNNSFYTNLLREGSNFENELLTPELVPATQFTDEPVARPLETRVGGGSSIRKAQRRGNFTSEEDLLIVSAWLNISLDPAQGNQQTMSKYWDRIHEYFHTHKKFKSDRNANSLMNRWSGIQKEVNLYCGYYAQIEARNQSGITNEDKIFQAKQMYEELHGKPFAFLHCWHVLKHNPKWTVELAKKKSKSYKKISPAESSASLPNQVDLETENNATDMERPIGRKAAKEQQKKKRIEDTQEKTPAVLLLQEYMEENKKIKTE